MPCAPPANKPLPLERDNCAPYLAGELGRLERVRIIVPLGAYGWEAAFRAIASLTGDDPRPRPRFGHGAETSAGGYKIVGSYHPLKEDTHSNAAR